MSRYIDADAFLAYELKRCDNSMPYVGCCTTTNNSLKNELERFPTADVVEVKHEHWRGFTHSRFYGIDEYGEPIYRDGVTYRCSNRLCNKGTVIKYPYCPWCGARMDGVE